MDAGRLGRRPLFDRGTTRRLWDLDRAPAGVAPSLSDELEGLSRALALAVPLSAGLWIFGGALLLLSTR